MAMKRLSNLYDIRGLLRASRHTIRKFPFIHHIIHNIAILMSRSSSGAQFIKEIIEPQYPSKAEYKQWIEQFDTLSKYERYQIINKIELDSPSICFSLLMPVYNVNPIYLRQAIDSVVGQIYPNWQLCIVDDASDDESIWEVLKLAAKDDPRIKVQRRDENGNVCAASNDALALSTGDYVAFLDHDDTISERALYDVFAAIKANPNSALIYSDEDKIDGANARTDPYFKPDWDGELILSQNYVNHLAIFRRQRVIDIGGLRVGLEGAQDHDLVLRFTEGLPSADIVHIPRVLYHWRQLASAPTLSERGLEKCRSAACRAVTEHLLRMGDKNSIVSEGGQNEPLVKIKRMPKIPHKKVSVIIPTRDRAELLRQCIDSIFQKTTYPNYEILIVDNDSTERGTFAFFDSIIGMDNIKIIPAPGPFNYSRINNIAAQFSRGEILIFLNNDIVVHDEKWMPALVAQAERPNVGIVGAKLLFGDGRIQHGGIVLGVGREISIAGNLYSGASASDLGYFGHLSVARNVSAVTGACMAIRKSLFLEVGGFEEEGLPIAYNDVDLCLRAREAGFDVIWTPDATLTHLESASRGTENQTGQLEKYAGEIAYMNLKWGRILNSDPFYGPHFDRLRGDFRLKSGDV